jgi:hypothetical protein
MQNSFSPRENEAQLKDICDSVFPPEQSDYDPEEYRSEMARFNEESNVRVLRGSQEHRSEPYIPQDYWVYEIPQTPRKRLQSSMTMREKAIGLGVLLVTKIIN